MDGDDKKDKRKKKESKRKGKRVKKHAKYSSDKTSGEGEMRKDDRNEEKKTFRPRDEWMTMSYIRQEEGTIKTPEEQNTEAKQKKMQEEIDAGMREPVTGMVYGLYDPKNPDAAPTISSQMVRGERQNKEIKEGQGKRDMPLFGDGGASWRAKMLKQAQDRARSSGVALEEVVNERFGSVSALMKRAKGSARNNAHLQYKRHRIDDDEVKTKKEQRTVKTGRDASDKALLSSYSMRVQRSVARNVKDDNKHTCDESRRHLVRSSNRSDIQEEDGPVDFDKLPNFEDHGARNNASRRSRTRDDNGKSFQRSDICTKRLVAAVVAAAKD